MESLEFNIDLDGLGTNWQGYVLQNHFPEFENIEVLNQHPRRIELMRGIYEREPRLFRNLPKIDKYQRLLRHLTERGVTWRILTAIGSEHPSPDLVREDKLAYLWEHFGVSSDKIIISDASEDKVSYAGKGKVLIDDFKRNCREWEGAGGTALYVEANTYCIDDLIKRVDSLIDNA